MSRDDILRMAAKSNVALYGMGLEREKFIRHLEQFATLVASAEREACAEICKKHADVYEKLEKNPTAQSAWAACIDNRDAIRSRGQA